MEEVFTASAGQDRCVAGPASKCLEEVERWGALEARAALGTVGVPVGDHGGDALSVGRVVARSSLLLVAEVVLCIANAFVQLTLFNGVGPFFRNPGP